MILWHGTTAEYSALALAVYHNCECGRDTTVSLPCPAHRMIDTDQRALDHLLFAYRIRDRFVVEEERDKIEPIAD